MNRKTAKKAATIEARMNSSRLPGKILKPILGKPSLERLVERVRRSRWIDEVIVATTTSARDDEVEQWAGKAGVCCFRGSEEDVLARVLDAAKAFGGEIIVELTGDCPLIDPEIIDELMALYISQDFDYVSNILERTYPRGLDTQIFSTAVLEEVSRLTQDPADRENVSLYIYEHPDHYKLGGIRAPKSCYGPDLRICVDTIEDFDVVESVYKALYPRNPGFGSADIVKFLRSHPKIAALNACVRQKAVRPG